MKVLFISSAYSENFEIILKESCKNNSSLQYALNTFQHSFIDGLIQNKIDFEVNSFPAVPCWPHNFKKIYTPEVSFTHNNVIVGKSIKYCTIVGIKDFSIKVRVKYCVKDWIKRNKINHNERFAVITYQPSSSKNGALAELKTDYPNMIISTIVADFYDYHAQMEYARKYYGLLKRIHTYLECKSIIKLYSSIDKYILLTKAMEEGIPEALGKNIVMEGLSDGKWISNEISKKSDVIRTIAYTGQLGPNSGVKELIDAFLLTNDKNFRLVITGNGKYADYIKEKSLIDDRIIFKGIVSKDEMLSVQQTATVLINPRTPSTGMTKFSFPSKIMEYFAAGTPVLSYRLDGIPEEYYNYCYAIDCEGINVLSNKISEILSLPQTVLDEKAENALLFLKQNKTAKVQVARVIEFIKK